MGGNALQKPSIRLKAKDYFNLWNNHLRLLEPHIRLIPAYTSKKDFGDMDIITNVANLNNIENMVGKIKSTGLKVIDYSSNSDVKSYGIETKQGIFQLDVIYCHPNWSDFAYNFFAYNDLGNLIGRISRGIGLKFGHKGLEYPHRIGASHVRFHLLTRNFFEALEYLDLSKERYLEGFATPEDIYEFVVSSKYFNYSHFDLTKRNHAARVRDRKRVMYKGFLEYITKNNLNLSPPHEKDYLCDHQSKFPHLIDKMEKFETECRELDDYKMRFNGRIIMEVTGLSGVELGDFIRHYKGSFSKDFVLSSDDDAIRKRIFECFNEFKK